MNNKIEKLLKATLYICMVAVPLMFYLMTYDSCQVKLTMLQIGGTIAAAGWFWLALRKGQLKKRLLWDLPVFLYLAWGIVSFIQSPYKSMSNVDELIRLFCYTGIYLTASDYLSQSKPLRKSLQLLVSAVTVAILYGILQYFGSDPFAWQGAFGTRMFSTFGNPNFYAAFLVLTAPLILAAFFYRRDLASRIFLGILFLANIISLFLTGSKGGWLGIAGSLVFFTLLMVRYIITNKKVKTVLIVITLLGLVISSIGVYNYSKKRFDSILFRLLTWRSTIEMINQHPIIGNGLGTFRLIYPAYRDKVIFRIEGKHQTETQHPENEYFEIASDQGAIGIAIYFWMLFVIIMRGLERIKGYRKPVKGSPPEDNYNALYLIGFLAGLIGLLAHNLFCVNLRFVSSGMFLWLFLGIISGPLPVAAEEKGKKPENKARAYGWLGWLLVIVCSALIVVYIRFFIADYRHNIGIYYSKTKMWDAAIEEYQATSRLNPFFVMSRYFLGNVYNDRWAKGDDQKALEQYNQVIKMAPNYVMVHYQIGTVYLKQGRYLESLEEFQKTLKLDPVYAQTYFRIGMVYSATNQLDLAAENYKKAIELDPAIPDFYVNYGNIFFLNGSLAEAEKNYRLALSLDQNSLLAKRNLGLVYVKQGKNNLALELFRDVLRSGPADPELEKMVKNLSL